MATRMSTRIKMCGITRPQDAKDAAELGVDAIGLVFYDPSPRHVSIEQACAVIDALPPFVTTVGLFVNASVDEIRAVLDSVKLDLLQFHGDESPEFCADFDRPWVKAIRMKDGVDLQAETSQFKASSGLLLDAYHPALPGGTGESFEWERVPSALELPVILAGGLSADNVGEAIRTVQPYAVDVSGGIEAEKGIKDWGKMADFVAAVRAADTQST
ncbi:MAG: phosphoribosylanthranilate isomerase [Ectothiorhodospiraceae bacterium]|nr:phosphoribosylanthranilate isomerase [Ectothiorhodospiraceae bacterium]